MASIKIDGRSVSARTYLDGLRYAKACPDTMFKTSLRGNLWPATGAEILEQYREDLQTRITERGGAIPTSRVHPCTWAKASTPRVVLERHDIQTMNRSAKRRLAHRQRDEY